MYASPLWAVAGLCVFLALWWMGSGHAAGTRQREEAERTRAAGVQEERKNKVRSRSRRRVRVVYPVHVGSSQPLDQSRGEL